MIYDCFSFFNELDLLEIRLETLDNVVDKFVLAESNYTHTGKPKPLYYKINKARFAKFNDKIIHVISPDPDDPERATRDVAYGWLCENRQRNATIRAIEPTLKDDDIIIVSDLDEIPNPKAIITAAKSKHPIRLQQKLYYYYLNYRCCTTPFWNTGSVVLSYRAFKNEITCAKISLGEAIQPQENKNPTATKVRFLKGIKTMRNGGWHFSYIGGINKILEKLDSIVEGKTANLRAQDSILECIRSGNDIYGRGEWFFAENISSKRFPPAIIDYADLIFPVSQEYIKQVRIKRLIAYAKWAIRPIAWKIIPHALAIRLSKRFARI